MSLITFNENGLYCHQGGFYIDPWNAVRNAVITHAHADHATSGHGSYLACIDSVPILKFRLGSHINISSIPYRETTTLNGVKISFHSAGHIIGSAQIRLEYKGEIWVVSGDYKLENDGFSGEFESVKCHHFVTESTFGHPAFKWRQQQEIFDEINLWWQENAKNGKVSIISAYSLGKAQRLLTGIDTSIGPVFTHAAIDNTNQVLKKQGLILPPSTKINQNQSPKNYPGALVLAPPAAIGSAWTRRFKDFEEATVSGWMAVNAIKSRRNINKGFVLSDHADWEALNLAVKMTGAENIYVTHGYTELYSKYLLTQGYNASVVKTTFSGDEDIQAF